MGPCSGETAGAEPELSVLGGAGCHKGVGSWDADKGGSSWCDGRASVGTQSSGGLRCSSEGGNTKQRNHARLRKSCAENNLTAGEHGGKRASMCRPLRADAPSQRGHEDTGVPTAPHRAVLQEGLWHQEGAVLVFWKGAHGRCCHLLHLKRWHSQRVPAEGDWGGVGGPWGGRLGVEGGRDGQIDSSGGRPDGWMERQLCMRDGRVAGEMDGCVGEGAARIDRQMHRWKADARSHPSRPGRSKRGERQLSVQTGAGSAASSSLGRPPAAPGWAGGRAPSALRSWGLLPSSTPAPPASCTGAQSCKFTASQLQPKNKSFGKYLANE